MGMLTFALSLAPSLLAWLAGKSHVMEVSMGKSSINGGTSTFGNGKIIPFNGNPMKMRKILHENRKIHP